MRAARPTRPYHKAMPLRWPTLFRLFILLLMAGHVFVQYSLAREAYDWALTGSALFALAMLVPLASAVAIPELPEIYDRTRRHRKWEEGRCPACGYPVRAGGGIGCPECGGSMEEPVPYRFTWATVRRFAIIALVAWLIGCAGGETWAVADPGASPGWQ